MACTCVEIVLLTARSGIAVYLNARTVLQTPAMGYISSLVSLLILLMLDCLAVVLLKRSTFRRCVKSRVVN